MKTCRRCGETKAYDLFKRSSKTGRPLGECKACQVRRSQEYQRRNPEANANWWRRNPVKRMWFAARNSARRSGVPFDITQDDIVIPERCPVFGTPFQHERSGDPLMPSIDRIVPALGYVRGNVRVISWRANRMKQDASAEDLRALLRYLESNLPKAVAA